MVFLFYRRNFKMNNQHWVHSPLVSTLSIGKFNSIYSAAPFKASRLGNFEEVRSKNNTTTKHRPAVILNLKKLFYPQDQGKYLS